MADPNDPRTPDVSRLAAQRNAAVAAAFLLTGVLICAGWALENIPRREAAANRKEIIFLHARLTGTEQALRSAEAALRQAEEALTRTEQALTEARRGPS
jgi:septal ring factor EnvC (AmiA/AmiB activator)